MKKLIMVMVMLAIAAPAMAFHASSSSYNDYDCDGCHIPHNADPSLVDMPLWNGVKTAQESFVNYGEVDGTGLASETLDATIVDPEGTTLLCLACHDATDEHNHYLMNEVGGNLQGTHPMEFVYDVSLANVDGELKLPTEMVNMLNLAGEATTPTIDEALLSPTKSYVNCMSCHDIHIQGLHGYSASWSKFDNQMTDGAVDGEGDPLATNETHDPLTSMADGAGLVWEDNWTWNGTGWDPGADGVADLYGAGGGKNPLGDPVAVLSETNARTGDISFGIPHLQNIAGIAWKTGWGGDAEVEDDYELNYGDLCLACHIK